MDTSDIIALMGGTKRMAAVCAVPAAAVSLWKRTGIPPKHWQGIVKAAKKAEISAITFDAIHAAWRMQQTSKPTKGTDQWRKS